jgi:nucleoside 2-deoxyribosyltransferase
MKIKRYTAGRTNVERLADQQSKIVPPGQIAAAEAAPFMAFSDALESAGDTVLAIKQARDKATDADDATKYELGVAKAKDRLDRSYKQAKAENWSPDQLRENNQQIIKEFLSNVDSLSERNRDKYAQSMGLQAESWAENTRLDASILQAEQASTQWNASMTLALENKNIEDARRILEVGIEHGLVDQEGAGKFRDSIQELQVDAKATGLYETWEDQRALGKEEGVYNAIVNNRDLDPEVKDLALEKIEAQIENIENIEQKYRRRARAAFERGKTDLLVALRQNEASTADIDAFIRQVDALGDDQLTETASGWRNELYLASLQGAQKDVDDSRFRYGLLMSQKTDEPGWIVPDAANRKRMDAYVQDLMTDDMPPEERYQTEIDQIKLTGVPTANIYDQVEAGAKSSGPQSLINAAEIWNDLRTIDGNVKVVFDEMEVGDMATVIEVANKIEANIDPTVAAQESIEMREAMAELPEETRRILSNEFEKIDVADEFEKIAEPLWATNPDVFSKPVAMGLYQSYLYDAFMTSKGRDPDVAIEAANKAFTQRFRETRINGQKEIQDGGIGGPESENVGKQLFAQHIKGRTWQATDGGSKVIVRIDEQDDITFRDPYVVGGIMHYPVFYKDAPLYTEDGKNRYVVTVDGPVLDALQDDQTARKRQELEKDLQALQSELRGQSQTIVPPPGAAMPLGIVSAIPSGENVRRKGAVRDIPKEIDRIKRQIAELDK